jgi:hypothetical protein
MFLVDRHITGSAVDFGCRGDNQPFHSGITSRLTDIERALDICVHVAVGSHIAVRNGNQCGKVENRVTATSRLTTEIRVAHIAVQHFQVLMLHAVEPTPIVERVVNTQSLHFTTLCKEHLREV